MRDADEVIRNEATLLYQPCELGYAADNVADGAAGAGGVAGEIVCFLLSSCFLISFWTGITEFVTFHSARFAHYFSILNLLLQVGQRPRLWHATSSVSIGLQRVVRSVWPAVLFLSPDFFMFRSEFRKSSNCL